MFNHQLEQETDGTVRCSVCTWVWRHPPSASDNCPGVPRFGYGRVPAHLLTYTQLRQKKLKPHNRDQPDGCYYAVRRKYWLYLYDERQALPRRTETPAQKAARERAWIALQERLLEEENLHLRGEVKRLHKQLEEKTCVVVHDLTLCYPEVIFLSCPCCNSMGMVSSLSLLQPFNIPSINEDGDLATSGTNIFSRGPYQSSYYFTPGYLASFQLLRPSLEQTPDRPPYVKPAHRSESEPCP